MVEFRDTLEGVTPALLEGGFFEGWPQFPSPEEHLRVLAGSFRVVLAFDGDRVVGFANAISDGWYMAYVPLLEVLPKYRRRGIGSELVRRLLSELDSHYHVGVVCDPDVQPFYERLGLIPVAGAVQVNRDRQATGGASATGQARH